MGDLAVRHSGRLAGRRAHCDGDAVADASLHAPELATAVGTPAGDPGVARDRAGVIRACGYRGNATREAQGGDRDDARTGRAVAELAGFVGAPAGDPATAR